MAFTRPTLQELITRVEGDLKSGLQISTVLRRSFVAVIARAMAGLAHMIFGFMKFIEKNAFPDTAEDEYLERWAGIWGVIRKSATYEKFNATVTGTNGTVIPAGRTYRRADGVEYTTDAVATISGGTATLALTAVEPGKAGRVAVSDLIPILSPIAGLDQNATVSAITLEADDLESTESLRERLIDRIQNPPAGGAALDYVAWARSIAGVTRAWVGPQALGPGTVVVYIVTDDNDPITPSPAKIDEVADYIETVRPVTANVTVVGPVLLPIDLTIAIKPNTPAVQDAIETELKDLIYRESALAGSYKAPGVLHDGKILLSHLNEAISIALDEEDHEIIDINTDPPADVVPSTGELTVLGTITWQTLV